MSLYLSQYDSRLLFLPSSQNVVAIQSVFVSFVSFSLSKVIMLHREEYTIMFLIRTLQAVFFLFEFHFRFLMYDIF